MRRVALIVLVSMGLAPMAPADSAFDFKCSYGVFLEPSPGDFHAVSNKSLVQLIWTADKYWHPAAEGNLNEAGYALSGDFILFQSELKYDGGWSGDLDGFTNYIPAQVGGNPLPSGWVYARVFDYIGSSPTAGTWFTTSPLLAVTNQRTNTPPDDHQLLDVGPDGGMWPGYDGPGNQGSVLNEQVSVIPEPASLAMLGMGLAALGFWRVRRR